MTSSRKYCTWSEFIAPRIRALLAGNERYSQLSEFPLYIPTHNRDTNAHPNEVQLTRRLYGFYSQCCSYVDLAYPR